MNQHFPFKDEVNPNDFSLDAHLLRKVQARGDEYRYMKNNLIKALSLGESSEWSKMYEEIRTATNEELSAKWEEIYISPINGEYAPGISRMAFAQAVYSELEWREIPPKNILLFGQKVRESKETQE